MNDDTIQPNNADDLAILAVLSSLERQPWEEGFIARGPAELGESAETLTRLYTEALGLLPWELATPPPAVLKERLMAIVHGDETQEVEAPAVPPVPEPVPETLVPVPPIPPPAAPPAPVTPIATRRPASGGYPRPVAPPAPAPPPVATVPAPPPPPPQVVRPVRRSRGPLLALAAMLVLALGLAGFLLYGLLQQGEKIDNLTRDRNTMIERLKSTSDGVDGMKKELADLQARAALMTSPGVEIMPLRPTAQAALPEGAYGMLFVAADHQHWHLALHGLPAAGPGRQYRLWFVNPQGAVSGGSFSADPGATVSLSSEHMPSDIQAITVTVEPATAPAVAPTGPEVMRAGPPVKVL